MKVADRQPAGQEVEPDDSNGDRPPRESTNLRDRRLANELRPGQRDGAAHQSDAHDQDKPTTAAHLRPRARLRIRPP